VENVLTLQVAKRGTITLPKALRVRYRIREGDGLMLLDLGGVFVLTREHSQMDALADRISALMRERGEGLESVLQTLREDRDRVSAEQYPQA
jgi:bifunctional DNA-binding transcriptional regulator/antitoxin component of YhaV-PrlF toxin-antitoxin module